MYRTLLMAALVAAPMMMAPSLVEAQQRGSDRAQAARAAASQDGQQANQGQQTAPEGLRRAWEGRTPPPALLKRFPDLAPQEPEVVPEPEPAPAPEPPPADDCPVTYMPGPDGGMVAMDCNGNVVGME